MGTWVNWLRRIFFRVTPVGFAYTTTGQQYGFLQIDYLTLWNRDDVAEEAPDSGGRAGASPTRLAALSP